MILCIIIYNIFFYILLIFKLKNNNLLELRKYSQVLFFFFIDNIFNKKKRYSHEILSINMNLITTILLFLYYYETLIKLDFYKIFLLFLSNYCYVFSISLMKYITITYFINIFLLASIFGLSEIIFQIIYFSKSILNYEFSYIHIISFIEMFLNNYLLFYIIYYLSPCHSIISQCISFVFLVFINDIIEKNLLKLSLLFLIIISCLIYLEILELNFCNLNYNLKKHISERIQFDKYELCINNDTNNINKNSIDNSNLN